MTATLLSPVLLNTDSFPHTLQSYRTDSSLQRNSRMFQSLKKKLSPAKKDNSQSLASAMETGSKGVNTHPQSSTSQATRRPVNPFKTGEAPPPYSAGDSSSGNAPVFQQPTAYQQPAAQPAAYAQPGVQPAYAQSAASASRTSDNDPYAFLCSFDTIFLIDDSGSMAGALWRETKEALEHITPICTTHDADGIDIFFLNAKDSPEYRNITNASKVDRIFSQVRPGGATPTGQKLNAILKPYLLKYKDHPESTKPINIICITDGAPSDDVESPLIAAAKKLDKLDAPAWQIGIQFFQVGQDEQAKRHLKQLDDDLAEISGDDELRDIVDTVPFTGATGARLTADGILKVVLGAVNRRLDRKKSKDLHR